MTTWPISPRHLRLSFDASVDRVIGTDPDNPATADLTDVEAQTSGCSPP